MRTKLKNSEKQVPLASPFLFVGNALCLDFINTLMRSQGQAVETLQTSEALLAWMTASGSMSAEAAEGWRFVFQQNEKGSATLAQALALRAALQRIVEALPGTDSLVAAEAADVALVNELLRRRRGYDQITLEAGQFKAHFHFIAPEENPLVPVAESALELLCRADLSRIRKCENPECVLYFYDTSKNHTRRWCSMAACGNRHKAAAHYQRQRAERHRK